MPSGAGHGLKTMAISKLSYGLSIPFLISAGLTGLPLWRFACYAIPITVLQYAAFLTLGFYLGSRFTAVASIAHYAQIIAAAVVVLAILHVLGGSWLGIDASSPRLDASPDEIGQGMRIALATDIYLPQISGVADSVDLLARTLLGRGHAVRIYAPELPGAEPDPIVLRRPAWALPGSGGGLALVAPFGVLGDLRRFGPDIIHTHSSSTIGLAAMVAARRLGRPLVGTDHTFPADYLHYVGLDYAPVRFAARKAAALYYNRCAYVTTPSRSLLSELEEHGLRRPAAVVSTTFPRRSSDPCRSVPRSRRGSDCAARRSCCSGALRSKRTWIARSMSSRGSAGRWIWISR